ncbi:Hypothetical_protein [Hexamita inflata]|uniref:Hypothetical_protein n=1 Tax=Hexamita inflata TaxID=28002 RepID=A0AA86UQ36_9EUKA|nr:Hypothetical protein HINF_LOCUS47912 [Hexamita inflata]
MQIYCTSFIIIQLSKTSLAHQHGKLLLRCILIDDFDITLNLLQKQINNQHPFDDFLHLVLLQIKFYSQNLNQINGAEPGLRIFAVVLNSEFGRTLYFAEELRRRFTSRLWSGVFLAQMKLICQNGRGMQFL